MSAFDHLPLIDVTAYFNDPSIPDGANVGFVNENGIVFREGKAIGRDKDHPNFKMEKLRLGIEGIDRGTVFQTAAKPRREIRDIYDGGVTVSGTAHVKVAIATDGTVWLLTGQSWWRMPKYNLPPLPQE
jgi:hypothetical protein